MLGSDKEETVVLFHIVITFYLELVDLIELGQLVEHCHLLRTKQGIQGSITTRVLEKRWRDL